MLKKLISCSIFQKFKKQREMYNMPMALLVFGICVCQTHSRIVTLSIQT